MSSLALVIGMGEIGAPIWKMLVDAYGPNQVKSYDLKLFEAWKSYEFEFMHICFPQNLDFIEQVRKYAELWKPKFIIIHSTVSPGMTETLHRIFNPDPWVSEACVFYSPVRGNIGDGMEWCLRHYTKYISSPLSLTGLPEQLADKVKNHLKRAGFKVKWVGDTLALEHAKLWDLAWYGLNIAFYQELERLCFPSSIGEGPVYITTGPNYDVIREFIESTPIESEGKAKRVVFYGGHIGGHCVMQAIEKILAERDLPMLRAVIDSNMKRFIELTYSRPPHHPRD